MRMRVAPAGPVAMAVLLLSTVASAELRFDGKWKQTALREDFTVQNWLSGCGPPPQSTSTGGGEIVTIRMEGDELAIIGGGRVFRTNQCYDPMPNLTRESHSRASDGKTWRTRCTTPPADPRKAILNTLVVAQTEAHLDLVETGRYEITLENGRCMADVKRTRSFVIVTDESTGPSPTPAPAPTPTVKEEGPRPCAAAGEPAKLEVRPSKKLLRTGESFAFRGAVLDAKGCITKTAPTWKLADSKPGVAVDPTGKVTVAADAADGAYEIVATAAGKDARVVVEVTAPARYDELLARSGLNAAGETDEASSVAIATTSIGAGEGRVEDRARRRRLVFLAIVGSLLAVLVVALVVLQRRSRRAKRLLMQAEERHEAHVQEVLDRRRQREAEHAAQQRAHEESVARSEQQRAAPVKRDAKPDLTCPRCGRDFPSPTSFCPHDGTKLVAASKGAGPFPSPAALAQRPVASRGKICPTCGQRFEGGADYCGKDGTQLVLLN
jgi:hypothetical protein